MNHDLPEQMMLKINFISRIKLNIYNWNVEKLIADQSSSFLWTEEKLDVGRLRVF